MELNSNGIEMKASDKQINYIKYLLSTYEKIEDETQQLDCIINQLSFKTENASYESMTKEQAYHLIKNLKTRYNLVDTRFEKQFDSNCIAIAKNNYFELGWQTHSDKPPLFYFSFYNLMMIDWDDLQLSEIEDLISEYNETSKHNENSESLTFAIYETYNGYHGYCVSKAFPVDFKTMKLMKTLRCDPLYIQHCMKNGFIVRLSKKHDRNEPFVEKFVKYIGKTHMNPMLHLLVKTKDLCCLK
jgi:hypothetical protein